MLHFIHISDSHLGFSDLDILDEYGKNTREEDTYRAFKDAVDYIIEDKPDFVIHSGDKFHRSSPSNRALVIASKQILRITNAGIPFYMIAGNHDFPKSVLTSPIHDLYTSNDLTHIIYKEKLVIIETDKFILHLLPHINSEQGFLGEINKIMINNRKKPNILSMHLAVSNYAMNEFGERVFPLGKIEILKEFDYVALGHWHKYNHLQKYGNVFYSGSTERTSESQTGYPKGFIKVLINKETKTEFINLKLRTYEKIIIDKCYKKTNGEIVNEIKDKLNMITVAAGIFHIYLNELPALKANEIPRSVFENIFKDALYFSISKTIKGSGESIEIDSESFDLKERFLDELKSNFNPNELTIVSDYAKKIWDEIEEEEANANS